MSGRLRVLSAVGSIAVLSAAWLGACSKSECLKGACSSPGEGGSAGAADESPSKQGCNVNADCASTAGSACVEGRCRASCHSHFDCQGYGLCQSGVDSDGHPGLFCTVEHAPRPGQFFSRCASGTDADCDSDRGFFCVSAGAGDLDSYCTLDCSDDSSCAPGFGCAPLTRPPCETQCGLKPDPKNRSCIPNDQIGADKPYQCGAEGVTRNVCRPREFCSQCQNDTDCLASADQICAADQSGAKICTQPCDLKHPSCPWGSAASCGVWDKERGVATCAHRFGKCTGTGKGCEPCLKDADCGADGACVSSNFTGEHWCVDLSVHCSCASAADDNGLCSGGGCPPSPSGLALTCLDSTPMVQSSGICEGANTSSGTLAVSSSQQTGCWPVR